MTSQEFPKALDQFPAAIRPSSQEEHGNVRGFVRTRTEIVDFVPQTAKHRVDAAPYLLTAHVLIDGDQSFRRTVEELLYVTGLNVLTRLAYMARSDACIRVEKHVTIVADFFEVSLARLCPGPRSPSFPRRI